MSRSNQDGVAADPGATGPTVPQLPMTVENATRRTTNQ